MTRCMYVKPKLNRSKTKVNGTQITQKESCPNHRTKDPDVEQEPPVTIIQANPPGHSPKLKQYKFIHPNS